MTVTSPAAKAVHVTNGGVFKYAFPFKVFKERELEAVLVDGRFNILTLTLGTDYLVGGLGLDQGGTVTLTEAGRAKAGNGLNIVLLRRMDFVQETDYRPYDLFPAETHERALDILTMICQELREMMSRALVAPPNLEEPIAYADLVALLRDAEEVLAETKKALEEAWEAARKAEESFQLIEGDIANWKSLSTAAYDVPHGEWASAIYHPDSNMILFGVPRGAKGEDGRDGQDGRDGERGADGPIGPMGPVHPGPVVGLIDCGGADQITTDIFDCGQANSF